MYSTNVEDNVPSSDQTHGLKHQRIVRTIISVTLWHAKENHVLGQGLTRRDDSTGRLGYTIR